jgi:amino acid transporter
MVILKMAVVLLVIIVGAFYVDVSNWDPFVPNGFGGVMAGVSSVFFAYIGFDALSTTAEECKNPQRDLPRAMVYSIVICTVLYIIIALVLTGMVSYKELDVNDPLAFVFSKLDLGWFSGIIAVSAVVAMAGVFLVFQLGQPRIWMTMSRDGLLPPRFAKIHPRFKTPAFSTVVTAFFGVVPMLFIPSDTVLDLCSMGTLFAFVLVCGGVLKLQVTPNAPRGKFRTPYVNGKWIFPGMLAAAGLWLQLNSPETIHGWLGADGGWVHQIPMLLFLLTCVTLAVLAFRHDLSLIPLLGLVFCFYMMAQIPASSWFWFFVWLVAGLAIYFGYGYRHSKLRKA